MRFFDRPDDVRRARQCLDEAGFGLDSLTERLGVHTFAHLGQGELAPLLRSTRGGDGLDTLLQLFVFGMPVPVAAARAALQALPLEEWVAGGVLTDDDEHVSSRIAIRPVGGPSDWLIAHDFTRRHGSALPDDHVLGMSASTTSPGGRDDPPRRSTSAFDLGTGCGVQALYASAHSARVVASDLNPRAIACATLTMELNDLTNVAVRDGNLFDPVRDERFDLIVANPPFVISPSRRYLFRDNDLIVDELCRRSCDRPRDHLTDGGHCQLLASWAHVERRGLARPAARLVRRHRLRRPRARARGAGAVRPRRRVVPTDRVARPAGAPNTTPGWTTTNSTTSKRSGSDSSRCGSRAAGTPWFRAEEATQDSPMPCGDHLGAIVRTGRLPRRHPDATTPRRGAAVAPDVVLDERPEPERAERLGGRPSAGCGRPAGLSLDGADRRQRRGDRRGMRRRRGHSAPCSPTARRGRRRRSAGPRPRGAADVAIGSSSAAFLLPVARLRPMRESDLLVRLDVEPGRDRRSDLARWRPAG